MFKKRLKAARQHEWNRWHKEFINGLIELLHVQRLTAKIEGSQNIANRHCRKNGVLREVVFLHKGHEVRRTVQ